MTEEERTVLDCLARAHNLFVKLPTQHPHDICEWVDKLHDLQRIIMAREAVRNDSEYFMNVESSVETLGKITEKEK